MEHDALSDPVVSAVFTYCHDLLKRGVQPHIRGVGQIDTSDYLQVLQVMLSTLGKDAFQAYFLEDGVFEEHEIDKIHLGVNALFSDWTELLDWFDSHGMLAKIPPWFVETYRYREQRWIKPTASILSKYDRALKAESERQQQQEPHKSLVQLISDRSAKMVTELKEEQKTPGQIETQDYIPILQDLLHAFGEENVRIFFRIQSDVEEHELVKFSNAIVSYLFHCVTRLGWQKVLQIYDEQGLLHLTPSWYVQKYRSRIDHADKQELSLIEDLLARYDVATHEVIVQNDNAAAATVAAQHKSLVQLILDSCAKMATALKKEQKTPGQIETQDYISILHDMLDAFGEEKLTLYGRHHHSAVEEHDLVKIADEIVSCLFDGLVHLGWHKVLQIYDEHGLLHLTPLWYVQRYRSSLDHADKQELSLIEDLLARYDAAKHEAIVQNDNAAVATAATATAATRFSSYDVECYSDSPSPFPTTTHRSSDPIVGVSYSCQTADGKMHHHTQVFSASQGITITSTDVVMPTGIEAEKIKEKTQQLLKQFETETEPAANSDQLVAEFNNNNDCNSSAANASTWRTEYGKKKETQRVPLSIPITYNRGVDEPELILYPFGKSELPKTMLSILLELTRQVEFRDPHPKELPITDADERCKLIVHMYHNVPSLSWWLRIKEGEEVDWGIVKNGLCYIFLDFANVLWVYESDGMLAMVPSDFVDKYSAYIEPEGEAHELVTLYHHYAKHAGSGWTPLCHEVYEMRSERLHVPSGVLSWTEDVSSSATDLGAVHSIWHQRRLLSNIYTEQKLIDKFEYSQCGRVHCELIFASWTNVFQLYKESNMLRKVPDWFVKTYRQRLDKSNPQQVALMREYERVVLESDGGGANDEQLLYREQEKMMMSPDVASLVTMSNSNQQVMMQVQRRLGAMALGKAFCGVR